MNVAIGIQARSSSSRLPLKVLQNLGERPMILQLRSRLAGLGRSFVLTSTDPSDDGLFRLIEGAYGTLHVRRGSLTDVRSRFIDLACETKADIIVRVCGDSPFVEPLFIKLAIRLCEMHAAEHSGMILVKAKKGCLLEGMDVFTTKALFNTLDRDDPENLEHAGLNAMLADEEVQKVEVGMGPEYQNERIKKLSIDTPEDLKFAQRFWEHLQRKGGDLRRAISSWGS